MPPSVPPLPQEQVISLEEAVKKEPLSFAPPRKFEDRVKPKRKEVDTGGLRKILEESLEKKEDDGDREGEIKPGETIEF